MAENKNHIGNVKLSPSKKAIKVHIFKPNLFYVIPVNEIEKEVGIIYEYVNGTSEVVGEFSFNKNTKNYVLKIKSTFYYLKETYMHMLKAGSALTLYLEG